MSELHAGWARPPLARKFHYFQAGEIRALCNRWMYGDYGEREDVADEHKENCVECKRLVKKLRVVTP